MNNNTDRCSQLRTLQDQLVKQINTLKESVQKMEREGVESPVETVSIIKTLEKTLNSTLLELQDCPPETTGDAPASTLQQQAPASIAAQTVRRWFPDADQHDDDEGDSIIDEY